ASPRLTRSAHAPVHYGLPATMVSRDGPIDMVMVIQHSGEPKRELIRAQHYDRIRNQIEHDDEIINLHIVWQLLQPTALVN
ncbi:MAG: hypothetical protein M3Z35_12505, partial [Nitrospirota bacterium]|nr:hypothetical protein [Nitrospirota bacterium]